jgi:hypothetical protein
MTRETPATKGGTMWVKMLSGKFNKIGNFHAILGIIQKPQIYDMGLTALLPLRRKAH